MQAAVVHDGGVGQDPPRRQKRLPFKSAPAAWVDATRDVGGGAESKWKEMHPSDGPQPGYRPTQLYAAAHSGRPRPHRALLQLFRPHERILFP